MSGVLGVIDDIITTVAAQIEQFATAVVAAGAQILNDFLNALAGPAAHGKDIDEFSTQNSYLFNDDKYIDNLYNTDEIALNSLIKGTSVTDEIISFYRKTNSAYDFNLSKALDLHRGDTAVGDPGPQGNFYYTPYDPQVQSNFDLGHGPDELDSILPPVTLRINNVNLFEGEVESEYAGYNGR